MGSTKMKSNASKHPHAGKHFVVESGKLKGLSIKVSDFLQNQFQGKSIKSLSKRADIAPLIDQLKGRGFEVSETTLYCFVGKEPILIDDTEIHVQVKDKPKLKVVEDDSGETSTDDSGAVGSEGLEGRGVLSGTPHSEDSGEASEVGQSDSQVGSGAGSPQKESPRPDKPKAGTGKKDTKRK